MILMVIIAELLYVYTWNSDGLSFSNIFQLPSAKCPIEPLSSVSEGFSEHVWLDPAMYCIVV